jgi:hypothetical protein
MNHKRGPARVAPEVARRLIASLEARTGPLPAPALAALSRFPEEVPIGLPWVDLSGEWESVQAWAGEIRRLKKSYPTHRPFNPESDFIGKLAEIAAAVELGVPDQVDMRIHPEGDPGHDLVWKDVRLNVRGTPHVRNAWLVRNVVEKRCAPRYALVVIDKGKQRGALVGFATGAELLKARLINWGYGDCNSLNWRELARWRVAVGEAA